MDKLEEIKQFIANYKEIVKYARKQLGAGYLTSDSFHADGVTIYKLSKELGIQAELKENNDYTYPFQISATIDGFKFFGLLTFNEVKKYKLTKKCPMCDKKV